MSTEEKVRARIAENERLIQDATMRERARIMNIISAYVLEQRVLPYSSVGLALADIMRQIHPPAREPSDG